MENKKLFTLVAGVLIVSTSLTFLASCNQSNSSTGTSSTNTTATTLPVSSETTAASQTTPVTTTAGTTTPITTYSTPTDVALGNLVIVDGANYKYTKKVGEGSDELVSLWHKDISTNGTPYNLPSSNIFMTNEAKVALDALFGAFKTSKGNDWHNHSSIRALDINNQSGGEKSTGLFFQLKFYDDNTYEVTNDKYKADYEWISGNASKYGFIEYTISGTAGYFRYVGVAHAKYMVANSITSVSAYVDKIKTATAENPLNIGEGYTVYYTTTKTYTGQATSTWSGDNKEGYILTLYTAPTE